MVENNGIKLRGYQEECIAEIERRGAGRWLVVMATGLGKTVTFASLLRHGRVLLLSHRDELVHQPEKYYDCSFGVEKAGETSDGEEVVSASVATLRGKRLKSTFKPGDFDMIITDEAHHAVAASYKNIVEYLKPRVHIGFTATPKRADGKGLSEVFDEVVFSRDIVWGIKHGYLTDIDCRRVTIGWKTKGIHQHAGDFAVGELDAEVNKPKHNEQIVAAYKKLAVGQSLVFASSVSHAHALAALIDGARAVDATTTTAERRELIEAFTRREFPVLVNYGVFTEGTDLPLIETVLLARPTKNLGLYTQMVGRGLRPAPGKKMLRLIDCCGVSDHKSLCTAPSLFGIDASKLNKRARQVLDGPLSELKNRIQEADMCPAGWVLCDRQVDVYEKGLRVAWMHMSDGTLRVECKGVSVTVSGPDIIGRFEAAFHGTTGSAVHEYPALEDADMAAYSWLASNPATCDSDTLWDAEKVRRWGSQPASSKQLGYIAELATTAELAELTEMCPLSKHEARVLIENLKERQRAEQLERYGACPRCGEALKPQKDGKGVQCSSNKWKKVRGEWTLVQGCGYSKRTRKRVREPAADREPKGVRPDLDSGAAFEQEELELAPSRQSASVATASVDNEVAHRRQEDVEIKVERRRRIAAERREKAAAKLNADLEAAWKKLFG